MARAFKFRLESLLRLREVEEDRAKRRFYELLENGRRLERELRELLVAREDAKKKCRDPLGATADLDIEDVIRRQRYINVLLQRVGMKQEEIRKHHPELVKARTELREARRRRKTVEKLRDRKKDEFDLDEARRELRELDDVGQIYHGHRAGLVPQFSELWELRK